MAEINADNVRQELIMRLKDISSRWEEFGVQLNISLDQLKKFRLKKKSCEDCLLEMMDYWLKNNKGVKWTIIYNALENIDERGLRRTLMQTYPSNSQVQVTHCELVNALARVAHNWKMFGTFLKIEGYQLKNISQEKTFDECLVNVIDFWCDQHTPNYPMEDIYEALRHIDRRNLARELEAYFQPRSGVQTDGSDTRINDMSSQLNEMSLNSSDGEQRSDTSSCIREEELLTNRLLAVNKTSEDHTVTHTLPPDPQVPYSRPIQVTQDDDSTVSRTSQVYQTPHEESHPPPS